MLYELGLISTLAVCLWIVADVARSPSPLRRRLPVVLLTAAVALWSGGELGVWRAATADQVLSARRVLYAGTTILPVFWLWVSGEAAQIRWLRPTVPRALALALPLLLVYAELWSAHPSWLVEGGSRPPVFGPLFVPYVAFGWLQILIGTAAFLVAARRLGKADPLRVTAISLGALVPLAGNLVFIARGAHGMDYSPIFAGLGVALIRLFVFDAGLAGFLPVARRDVIEQLDSAVLVADLDDTIVDANSAAQRLLGDARLVGRQLGAVVEGAMQDRARAIEVRRSPVRGRLGVVGAFAVLTDRTDARRVERQLLLAHKLEALGVLTAGIAHEVNNPLAFVRANLAALEDLAAALRDPALRAHLPAKLAEVAQEAPDLVGESIEGVERIGRLVGRLRRFAREGGDTTAERAPVDLARVAEKARTLASVGVAADAIRCRLRDAPRVVANEDELVQIAVNLLVNAIQASRGVPEIEIRVGPVREGSTLVVRDRGAGIPDDALPRLFDPFFTTKAPGQGTGLGLSLSFDLARQNGGTLEARNRASGGAEFELWLPAAANPD